jgi:hypothetical protein
VAVVVGDGIAVAVGLRVAVADGASVLACVGVADGVGLSSGLERPHPPVPAMKMMAPVTLIKSRRVTTPTEFLFLSSSLCIENPPDR